MEPMVPIKDYIDKGDEATLARAELAVTQLGAKIDALPARILWIAAGTVVATVTLMVAILAFASDRFEGGMSATGNFASEVLQSKQEREQQAKALGQVNRKLDALITSGNKRNAESQGSDRAR